MFCRRAAESLRIQRLKRGIEFTADSRDDALRLDQRCRVMNEIDERTYAEDVSRNPEVIEIRGMKFPVGPPTIRRMQRQ